ncbi:LysR family transcriptional regulator [Enterococcus sp. LJL120]
MNIDYLEEFIELVKELNFFNAAENLFISQSTLSRHIQKLEKDLGVPIFFRSSKGVALTEYGRLFLAYAEKVTSLNKDLKIDIENHLRHIDKSIVIAADYNIMNLILSFTKINSEFSIQVIDSGLFSYENLLNNSIQFVFSSEKMSLQNTNIRSDLYAEDEYVIVLNKSNPLSSKDILAIDDLKNEKFVMPKNYSNAEKLIKKLGISSKIVFSGYTGSNIIDLIENNLGISLLLKKTLIGKLPENVVEIPIKTATEMQVYVNCLDYNQLSIASQLFYNYIFENP